MSEELFSFSNTGQPKAIAREFVNEVTRTLHWITDEATPDDEKPTRTEDLVRYKERFQQKVWGEKGKLCGSMMYATLHSSNPRTGDDNLDK
jgi:hypothetical protein